MMAMWRRVGGNEVSPAMRQDFLGRTAVFLGLYLLLVLPIIQANYFYIDDLGRVQDGLTQWGLVGRPLASVVLDLIDFSNGPITDLAPLPLLLAVVILASASAWTSMFAGLRFGAPMMPMGLLVCSPIMLENMSYRFDSVTMALAMALALLPFGLRLVLRGWRQHVVCAVALCLSLNLYQPALSVFVVLAFFAVLLDLRDKSAGFALRRAGASFVALGAALIAYKVEVSDIFDLGGLYMSEHSAMAPDAPAIILRNIQYSYLWLAGNLIDLPAKVLVAAMALGVAAYLVQLRRGRTSGGFIVLATLSLPCFAGMILGIFGVTILLREPIWVPRVCMGFGAVSACLVSFLTMEGSRVLLHRCASGLVCCLLFGQLALSFAYGNALHAQATLEAQLSGDVAEDAFRLAQGKPAALEINGVEPVAPAAAIAEQEFPIIKVLLPLPLNGEWMWGGVKLRLFGLPANIQFGGTADVDAQAAALEAGCKMDGMMRNRYFSMYKTGDVMMVDFNRKCG